MRSRSTHQRRFSASVALRRKERARFVRGLIAFIAAAQRTPSPPLGAERAGVRWRGAIGGVCQRRLGEASLASGEVMSANDTFSDVITSMTVGTREAIASLRAGPA